MPKAIWNGIVIAESDKTLKVEGNHYFPPNAIKKAYFRKNGNHTVCPWKGTASYYDIVVDGKEKKGAAWYYPKPSKAAAHIKNHVAFYGSVKIVHGDRESGGSFLDRLRSLLGG